MLALQLSSFTSMYLYSKASSNVLAVIFLRLYLSGDVELNPGPKHGQLTTEDMKAVQAVLWAARERWYNIGLELGVSADDLEVIKKKHSNNPDQCLTELLYHWLKKDNPTPTWSLIVSALRSPSVGYSQLAIEIEKEQLGSGSSASAGESTATVQNVSSVSLLATADAGTLSSNEMIPPLPFKSISEFQGLSPEQKEELEQRLKMETEDIKIKFSLLRNKFFQSLDAQNLPVKTLVRYLEDLNTLPKAENSLDAMNLKECKDLEKVKDAIVEFSSFFDFRPVEYMIELVGLGKDKERLAKYTEDFKHYVKRRIYECSSEIDSTCTTTNSTELRVKLESDYSALVDFKQFQCRLSIILNLSIHLLRLCSFKQGCIELIFHIPNTVQEAVFPLSNEQEEALIEEGIIQLSCGQYHLTTQLKQEIPTTEKLNKEPRSQLGSQLLLQAPIKERVEEKPLAPVPVKTEVKEEAPTAFSGLAITQEGSEKREYCSQIFYLGRPHSCNIHFVVTWNTEAHLTVVEKEYARERAVRGPKQLIDFESDAITLDIPMNGISVKGWTITPLTRPMVTKEQVDNFKEGKIAPCCQLKAEVSKRRKNITELKLRVALVGAKYLNNVLIIDLPFKDPYSQMKLQTFGDLAAADEELGPPPYKKSRVEDVVTPFNPESKFTIKALCSLADAGIPLMSSLSNYTQQIKLKLGSVPQVYPTDLNSLFSWWVRDEGAIPPTWRNLLQIVRQLNLDDLAYQVETYLRRATSEHQPETGEGKTVTTEGIGDVPLHVQEDTIDHLKQEIASLTEERDFIIFENKKLRSENELLKSQLLAVPIKEEVEEKPLALVPVKTEVKEEAVTVTKAEPTSPQPTSGWELRGVEVYGEMTVVVHSSRAQQITWEEFGLKLHIDEGSLPAGVDQCRLNIKASLAGQYEFPDNLYLVSAIFWLHCEPMCKFTKPVTVEMQHCAKREKVEKAKLTFARAVCSQKQLPYTFKQLGGDFRRHRSYGVVDVNSFSALAITQERSEEREYCSQLFYIGRPSSCNIHFVVTWNTEAHLTVVKNEYWGERTVRGPKLLVEFESDAITLDIPMDDISFKGWTITPLVQPVVTKKQVDNFREGKIIPCCQLKAKTSRKKVPELIHHITLVGAKYPNVLTVDLPIEDPYSQTFGDLAASALGPPPNKMSRLESDESSRLPLTFTPAHTPSPSFMSSKPVSSVSILPVVSVKSAIPKVKYLMRELTVAASDWEDIGIELEIEDSDLKQIKSDNSGDSKACLREMLRMWLSRVATPPSWSAIVEALDNLGHKDIAQRIRTEYCA